MTARERLKNGEKNVKVDDILVMICKHCDGEGMRWNHTQNYTFDKVFPSYCGWCIGTGIVPQ